MLRNTGRIGAVRVTTQDESVSALVKPQSLAVAAAIGVLCFVTALLEFDLILAKNLATPFWAANAIALTALLRSPRAAWPVIVVASGIGLAVADLMASRPGVVAAVYVLANMCEIIVAAVLLRRGGRPFELSERGDVIRFILVCGFAAPFISASIASLASWVSPGGFSLLRALSWYGANALGLVIFTPALWLSAGAHRAIGRDPRRIGFLAGLILLNVPIWVATAYLPGYSVPFLSLPILGYIALEFGVAGISLAILASALFSFGAAVLTLYIQAPNVPLANLLYRVEVFVAGAAVMGLPLGVIVDDKKRIQDALISCLAGGLAGDGYAASAREETVVTAGLIDGDGKFRLIARDGAPDPAIEGLDGQSIFDVMSPKDRRALKTAFENAVAHELQDTTRRLHARLNLAEGPAPVTFTLLSVRRGVAGERSEAMLLVESAIRPRPPRARAA